MIAMTQSVAQARNPISLPASFFGEPIGRSFILGLPDHQGLFHIYLSSRVWQVAPGNYGPGDRVYIVSVNQGTLVVQLEPIGACEEDSAQ